MNQIVPRNGNSGLLFGDRVSRIRYEANRIQSAARLLSELRELDTFTTEDYDLRASIANLRSAADLIEYISQRSSEDVPVQEG